VPIVTNHAPQMKYWRNIITESFVRTPIRSTLSFGTLAEGAF
jgi:hypothetical protein